jgi:hypothetical protein
MRVERHIRDTILDRLRAPARTLAYGIALLLSLVWLTSALAACTHPLLDLGRGRVGDAIVAFAHLFDLAGHGTLLLDLVLVGLRLLLGTYLVMAVIIALYQRLRWRLSDDRLLDIGLFVSAIASIVAAAPLAIDGAGLRVFIGELMLCVIASGLTGFARITKPAAEAPVVTATPPQDSALAA